jgi:PST family polysaccharide transporter
MNDVPPGSRAIQNEGHFETKHLQTDLKKRAIKGAGFTIAGQTINFGVQTVGTIILARLLTPGDFGVVTMAATFSLLLENFGVNGFTEAVVQREDLGHQEMSKLFWLNFVIMSGLTLAFIAMSPLIVWFFKEPNLSRIIPAMAPAILFSGLTTCHIAVLIRSMKFHLTSLTHVLAGTLSTLIAIFFATRGTGYWALVIKRVSLPMVTAIFAWLFCKWRPGIPSKGTKINSILRYGLHTYGNFFVDYLRKNSDKIVIGKFFGKSDLGHYDRAGNLAALLPNQLTAALSRVGVATLSRLKNDPKRFLEYYAKSLSILAFIAFPGSILFILIGKGLILVLLGGQWGEAGDMFTALAPAIGLVVIYDTNIWLHLSLGRPERLLKWGIFVLITAIISFFLGSLFGPIGVGVAYSVLFYVLLLPALYFAGRPLSIRASFYISILWRYWLSAIIAGGLCWILRYFLVTASPTGQLSLLLKIIIIAFTYVFLYLGIILALFRGPKPISLFISTIREIF